MAESIDLFFALLSVRNHKSCSRLVKDAHFSQNRRATWTNGRQRQTPHPVAKSVTRVGHPRARIYSMRRAFIGSMLAARRAGMNPASVAKADKITTDTINVNGS